MEIKAEEIRLEIISCFVEKHEYWSNRQGRKNWIAHIRGLDPYYGYKREFLQPVLMGHLCLQGNHGDSCGAGVHVTERCGKEVY